MTITAMQSKAIPANTSMIHVIEDEPDIAKLIEYNLGLEGFQVTVSQTGEKGLEKVRRDPPDLILLDLMLPGLDGLEVCRRLRATEATSTIPLIMATAKGDEQDIIQGLELGADDYVVKPFSPKVLIARVHSVLRRFQSQSTSTEDMRYGKSSMPIEVHSLAIHPGRHEVLVSGKTVDLTRSEFQILYHLCRHPGWVFTRGQIVEAVNGDNYSVTERAIDVQMVRLRQKLGDSGVLIETIRGVGYRFKD